MIFDLVVAERKKVLARFPPSSFKRVAVVAMGEPPENYKAKIHGWMLTDKVKEKERESYRNWIDS